MICENCEGLARKLNSVMSKKEIVQILSAEVAMMRSLDASGREEDKSICNSIITKCLLALDKESRDGLIELLGRAGGMRIRLDHCQHSLRLA
jgi:hypothetical protein